MFVLKILSILFVFTTLRRASANSLDIIQEGLNIASLVPEEATGKENPITEDAEEILLENILTSDFNKTGLEKELSEGNDCEGSGLLGFIQCAIRSKIESFSLELGKVAIPDQPPEGFKPHFIDSKIEGGLEEWFQKYKKQIDSLNV